MLKGRSSARLAESVVADGSGELPGRKTKAGQCERGQEKSRRWAGSAAAVRIYSRYDDQSAIGEVLIIHARYGTAPDGAGLWTAPSIYLAVFLAVDKNESDKLFVGTTRLRAKFSVCQRFTLQRRVQ